MTSPTPPRGYHHGSLEQALIAATVALIEEQGLQAVSVREVARRAGVSSGAPFRHFASKTALMTAVAEQAMQRLTLAIQTRVDALRGASPLTTLREMGHAYVDWVLANRTHFLVISSRSEIDFAGSPVLVAQNEALRQRMIDLLRRAQLQGEVQAQFDLADLVLTTRAMTYGAARLWADGHFPQWQVAGDERSALYRMIDLFLDRIAAPPVQADRA